MRIIGVLILIFLFVFLFGSSPIDSTSKIENKKIKVKIFVVNSYSVFHPYTASQLYGFRKYLKLYTNTFNFSIHGIDMRTLLVNNNEEACRKQAKEVIKEIYSFNPDIVYITNDDALIYVGIPISKKYPIIASGLNESPKKYISKYHLTSKNKILFIYKQNDLSEFFRLLDYSNIVFDKVYLIMQPNCNITRTSYFMVNTYIKQFKHIPIIKYRVSTENQLISLLKELNRKKEVGVIIPAIEWIYDSKGKKKDKTYIISLIRKYNRKHLELSDSSIFCRYGMAICTSSSFYDIGYKSGNLIVNYLLKIKLYSDIQIKYLDSYTVPNKLFVNKQRLEELGYSRLINQSLILADRVYTNVEKFKPYRF